MSNPANLVTLTGRLARDPQRFANADGSAKVTVTLAVEDNFASGKGAGRGYKTSYIDVETFIPAGQTGGGWAKIFKGSLIQVLAHVDAKPYVAKSGETVYPMKLVADGFPTFLEPRSVVEQRLEARKNAEQAQPVVTEPVQDPAAAALQAQIEALQAQLAAGSITPGVNYDEDAPF